MEYLHVVTFTGSPSLGVIVVYGSVVISCGYISSCWTSSGRGWWCGGVAEKWLAVDEGLGVEVAGTGAGDGGVIETFVGGSKWGGLAEGGLIVLHMGGCDVINHGGLGRLVVVVVVANTVPLVIFMSFFLYVTAILLASFIPGVIYGSCYETKIPL